MNLRFLIGALGIHIGACLIVVFTSDMQASPSADSRPMEWHQVPEAVREIQNNHFEIVFKQLAATALV
jgi:hypothetical protein